MTESPPLDSCPLSPMHGQPDCFCSQQADLLAVRLKYKRKYMEETPKTPSAKSTGRSKSVARYTKQQMEERIALAKQMIEAESDAKW